MVQVGGVVPHVAAILTDVTPFGTRLRRITRAPGLAQLSLVLRDVPRVVTDVLSILRDVAAVVTRLATILPQLSPVANGIPLMLRERLRRREAGLRRGLRPRRRREHNESDGHQR